MPQRLSKIACCLSFFPLSVEGVTFGAEEAHRALGPSGFICPTRPRQEPTLLWTTIERRIRQLSCPSLSGGVFVVGVLALVVVLGRGVKALKVPPPPATGAT